MFPALVADCHVPAFGDVFFLPFELCPQRFILCPPNNSKVNQSHLSGSSSRPRPVAGRASQAQPPTWWNSRSTDPAQRPGLVDTVEDGGVPYRIVDTGGPVSSYHADTGILIRDLPQKANENYREKVNLLGNFQATTLTQNSSN